MAIWQMKEQKRLTKIRILIADDHDLVREGLIARLNISDNMEICGEADNGICALQKAQSLTPDIIFLDISMPGMSGLEAAKKILSVSPNSKIIFLSVYDNPEYIHEALRIGAKGYLLKDVSREEMMVAVNAVFNGGTYLGSKVAHAFDARSSEADKSANRYKLSERESEVLAAIALGDTNKAIAEKLKISVRTVESHRLAIREKTGGGNAAALFKIADELGLV